MTEQEQNRINLCKAIEKRLPGTSVYWESAFDPLELGPRKLIAVSKSDSSKEVVWDFRGTLDADEVEAVADDFVTHSGQIFLQGD